MSFICEIAFIYNKDTDPRHQIPFNMSYLTRVSYAHSPRGFCFNGTTSFSHDAWVLWNDKSCVYLFTISNEVELRINEACRCVKCNLKEMSTSNIFLYWWRHHLIQPSCKVLLLAQFRWMQWSDWYIQPWVQCKGHKIIQEIPSSGWNFIN